MEISLNHLPLSTPTFADVKQLSAGAKDAVVSLKEAVEKLFGDKTPKGQHLTLRVDRGCQFTAEAFEKAAIEMDIELEYCPIQTSNDKQYVESFIVCYKRDEVYRNYHDSFFEAYTGWVNYMDWYDNYRPHGVLNNMSPKVFKEAKLSTILV